MSPRARALARFVLVRGALPFAAYLALAQLLARTEAATILLGAATGQSMAAVFAMLVLLFLRAYTALLFAPMLAYRLVQLALQGDPKSAIPTNPARTSGGRS